MPLSAAEKDLAAAIGFEEDVCETVKQHIGGTLERLTALNDEYESEPADGLSVAIDRQQVGALIGALQPELAPHGYRAFWSEIFEPNGLREGDEIAILKTSDPCFIIRLRRTDGGNYGVSSEDLLAKLKSWESRAQFEIYGAGPAWVALEFTSLPENICAFAEEIYEFCPDTVEQGIGLANEKDQPELFAAARELCPELSARMQQKLDEQNQRFQAMDIPPQLRAQLNSSSFTTPTDMGIRLLAQHLKSSHELFLWWD